MTITTSIRTSRRAAIGAAALGASALLGGPAAAQDATPTAGSAAGLGLWSDRLSTLPPDDIARLLLEQKVAPVGYNSGLVAAETTFYEDPDSPFPNIPAREVTLGFPQQDDGSNVKVGSGIFLIFTDAATAAASLQAVQPGQIDDTMTWAVPFAGLDGRWMVRGKRTGIFLLAGPVILVGTDEFLADGARLHLMNSISNVLQNIDHVLFHLYGATNEALSIS